MKRILLLFVLIPFILLTTACGGVVNGLVGGDDSIVFGTGTIEEGITEEKSTFAPGEDFFIETHLNEPFGTTELEFITLKLGPDDSEEFYAYWYEVIDPTWNSLIYEYHIAALDGAFEPGDYILRIYGGDSELFAEGNFTIE